ncbi:MAG: extracellular solute-binding protein [Chloroflexi bacterium]|nr:MAG: extracellular solute-binding protein [Chloroflexota bacterium]
MSKKLVILLGVLVLLSLVVAPGYAQEGAQCDDVYTVQADDWLSKLADRFFGTYLAYPAIVDATNAAANKDDSFAKIKNPDEIEVGQKLCIPSKEEAEAFLKPKAAEGKVLVEFWSTDNEEERVKVYEEVAARYMAQNPNVEIRIVPIEEAGVSQRIAVAVAANRVPDIVRMGIERVAAFAADGILDEDAATATIQAIGEDDFRAGPLQMVTNPATGKYSAVPFDGWIQAIWYRKDVFEQLGLEPPVTWDAISAACEKVPGFGNFLYGLTLGTDPGQNYGHQVFEQVAISNNAWPFDEQGNVTMNTPEMIEALRWYASLQECATPGPQYWRGAREAYEYDQAAMLFYSTYIMDDLVEGSGLEGGGKVQLSTPDLAARTGFAPRMEGPNGSATYGQLVTLAIMKGADPVAQDVVKFFLTEGYQDILALAPFGKVPVLKSAVDEWKNSSEYFKNYDPETLDQIANGYDTMQRWLFRPDYDAVERAVIGDIEGRLLIPQVISRIALEGSMTPEEGAAFLQEQVENLLAERRAQAQ